MTKPGRKKIEIDTAEIERLAGLGMTEAEICSCIGVSLSTITRRKKESDEFDAAIKNGKAKAGAIIANALFEKARSGDVASMIWYEKTRRGINEDKMLLERIEALERRLAQANITIRSNDNGDGTTNRHQSSAITSPPTNNN